jgi:hypothetical protein
MWNGIIAKSVGSCYEITCDRNKHTVSIFFKGKEKNTFYFSKMYEAVNFYARLKKVKDVKLFT